MRRGAAGAGEGVGGGRGEAGEGVRGVCEACVKRREVAEEKRGEEEEAVRPGPAG